jgi:hypothetical protein
MRTKSGREWNPALLQREVVAEKASWRSENSTRVVCELDDGRVVVIVVGSGGLMLLKVWLLVGLEGFEREDIGTGEISSLSSDEVGDGDFC